MKTFFGFWRRLSISKKLYIMFGAMACLVVIELLALSFVMETLSGVRAFVGGESQWQKGQKNAVNSLQAYIITKDSKYYRQFNEHLKVPLADRRAREELASRNRDLSQIRDDLLEGGIHREDIPQMLAIFERFQQSDFIQEILKIWQEGDVLIDEVIEIGKGIHKKIENDQLDESGTIAAVQKLYPINVELNRLGNLFSSTISKHSRQVEAYLFLVVLFLVLTVETTGFLLTMSISQYLTKGLRKMKETTGQVGEGNYKQEVEIASHDELGELADSINKMIQVLRVNEERREILEKHDRVKDLFLANMSHEIRTPISSILGYIQLLEAGGFTEEEEKHFYKVIKESGHTLNDIVSDILDVTKIESQKMKLNLQEIPLGDTMEDVKDTLKFKCEESNVDLEVFHEESLPSCVISDKTRFKQVLMNLVGNAVKYSPNGYVSLIARAENNNIVFDIKDTGEGISIKDQETIFEPFVQSKSLRKKKLEGVGLGLPLSRRLARMLGGDVVLVESKLGRGSHFRFYLPQRPDEKTLDEVDQRRSDIPEECSVAQPSDDKPGRQRALNIQQASSQKQKVLVIDDSQDILDIVKFFLEEKGLSVETELHARKGYEMAATRNYDLVIVDIEMPVMSGYELVSKLRQKGYKGKVVALSAHSPGFIKDKVREAGFDGCLTKPLQEGAIDVFLKKDTSSNSSRSFDSVV